MFEWPDVFFFFFTAIIMNARAISANMIYVFVVGLLLTVIRLPLIKLMNDVMLPAGACVLVPEVIVSGFSDFIWSVNTFSIFFWSDSILVFVK